MKTKNKTMLMASALFLLLGAVANSQEVSSLTCNSGDGKLYLDLVNETASIDVYCHALGCSGTGKIKSHERDSFSDIFLLEMNMSGSSSIRYMMVKLAPNGTGEIFNHPRASRLSSCIRN